MPLRFAKMPPPSFRYLGINVAMKLSTLKVRLSVTLTNMAEYSPATWFSMNPVGRTCTISGLTFIFQA